MWPKKTSVCGLVIEIVMVLGLREYFRRINKRPIKVVESWKGLLDEESKMGN
ncbi:hypothetical protein Fmac_015928 [Flemingia macrophylla]|uniref:Uncharacterized protein n=1 Tax=Flemingia macrophylla TaxID=520843 RepID=A0ABD1MI27_9FABA